MFENTDESHFLNVDLDIYSRSNLEPLVTEMGHRVLVLFAGRVKRTYEAHLELRKITKTADATIRDFCALSELFPSLSASYGTEPRSANSALAFKCN